MNDTLDWTFPHIHFSPSTIPQIGLLLRYRYSREWQKTVLLPVFFANFHKNWLLGTTVEQHRLLIAQFYEYFWNNILIFPRDLWPNWVARLNSPRPLLPSDYKLTQCLPNVEAPHSTAVLLFRCWRGVSWASSRSPLSRNLWRVHSKSSSFLIHVARCFARKLSILVPSSGGFFSWNINRNPCSSPSSAVSFTMSLLTQHYMRAPPFPFHWSSCGRTFSPALSGCLRRLSFLVPNSCNLNQTAGRRWRRRWMKEKLYMTRIRNIILSPVSKLCLGQSESAYPTFLRMDSSPEYYIIPCMFLVSSQATIHI